jgi:hypothetical protein
MVRYVVSFVSLLQDGAWHFVAVIREEISTNNASVTIYVDGVATSAYFPNGRTLDADSSISIGCFLNQANANYYNGEMDEVKFYDSAITTNELYWLMVNGEAATTGTTGTTGGFY